MALSGTFSFTVVRDDIIRESMLNVGAIGESEVPTAQEVTDCARKLNMMVKQWMGSLDFAPGLKMWTRQRGDLFLSSTTGQYALGPGGAAWAGGVATLPGQNYAQSQLTVAAAQGATTLNVGTTNILQFTAADFVVVCLTNGNTYFTTVNTINTGAGTFTIPAPGLPSAAFSGTYVFNYTTQQQRPIQVLTAVLRDVYATDIPLNIMTLQDYEVLPTKTQLTSPADPTAIYYESQFANVLNVNGPGQLYTDCGAAQDTTKHIHLVFLRPIMDFNNPGDNPEYPQQWYRPLCWGLSREICGMFDADWTKDMDLNYHEAMAMARQGDPETTSLFFMAEADQA
jgi:hypothetical protein